MSIKSDKWIRRMAQSTGMIEPFEPGQVRESADGQRIVKKLAARSDVLIENFKVGGLAKFGLDYQSLAPANPRLVYCSVTGFGQTGPYAARAGYDLMAQGIHRALADCSLTLRDVDGLFCATTQARTSAMASVSCCS